MVSPGKLKIYAIVAGIFVLGAGAGGAAGYAVAGKKVAELLREERSGLSEVRRFEGLASELDLNREQRGKVRAIMERHRDQNRQLSQAMFEKCGDELKELRSQVDTEIRQVLDEKQRQRFSELMEKRGHRFPLGGGGPRMRKGDRHGDRHKDGD
jgi:Spy/CpxP family protein refolding chaperone